MKIEIALHSVAVLAAFTAVALVSVYGALAAFVCFGIAMPCSWLALFLQRRRHSKEDDTWRKRWGL